MKKANFIVLIILVAIALIFDSGYYPEGTSLEGLDKGDTAWMLVATALVLLMTPGLAFFYGGMVNNKNIISTMLQSFIAMGVISIIWLVVGYSLAFGDSIGGVIGNPLTHFGFKDVDLRPSGTIPVLLFALFQLKFAIITPALITGSFAERVKFRSYILFVVLFSIFIYTPLAHMTWHADGLFMSWGVLDFAGGTVVHMSAGMAALAGAMYLGERKRKINEPSNYPFVILGTALLWFGWFGFNAGSALAANETAVLAFSNTNFAAAAAMITWVFYDLFQNRKISTMGACIAAVVGLVAITPAAGFVTAGQSIFIGFVAAIVSNLAITIKNKSGLDDTLDVFPCHGVGGIVGMILTGIFAKDVGLVSGEITTFLYHLLTIGIVTAFAFFGSLLLYKVVDIIIPMRVTEEKESKGLDTTQHDESFI